MIRTEKISISDKLYPERLRYIYNPPEILYFRGDISLLDTDCIASVGSRNASEYGKQVAYNVGKTAALFGVTLVSGMAKGIDGYSHRGVLDFKGSTIAVLGNGCDICYPKENRDIYMRIAEKCIIVSEYPDGYSPTKFTFPMRNRIISALSSAVIVCEAELSSGSMITAELAAEQGREIFSVPGNIFSPQSLGTNKLIADGARPAYSIPEIFTSMGFSRKSDDGTLSDTERIIISSVEKAGEITLSDISEFTGIDRRSVKAIVSVLEMKGFLSYYMGKVLIAK